MTLIDFTEKNRINYQVIQKMFLKIKVKSYFDFLTRKTGDKGFDFKCMKLLVYSDADSNYEFDFNISHSSTNENITIGELLSIASKMLKNSNHPDEAREIIYSLMVKPFIKYYSIQCVSNSEDDDFADFAELDDGFDLLENLDLIDVPF